jgi:NAD+ kinase
MATIGFIVHSQRKGAVSLALETAKWLREQGHVAQFLDAASPESPGPPGPPEAGDIPAPPEPAPDQPLEPGMAESLDLAVSMGGDGTMLRTVDLVSPAGVPVLGVNLGHLGYLTAVEPDALRDALRRFLTGDYQVESRMTLDVSVTDDRGNSAEPVMHRNALNDLVLQRPIGSHTIRVEVYVNGTPFLSFAADSLIVATPTGSTAYNLSARGPIVSPAARVQILTPVAPHMLFDRSLVLDQDDVLAFTPIAGQAADLVVDGWPATTLTPGQTLHCRRGDRDARLVTFGERDFNQILKRKFNLADR